jgi:hypothetical protein
MYSKNVETFLTMYRDSIKYNDFKIDGPLFIFFENFRDRKDEYDRPSHTKEELELANQVSRERDFILTSSEVKEINQAIKEMGYYSEVVIDPPSCGSRPASSHFKVLNSPIWMERSRLKSILTKTIFMVIVIGLIVFKTNSNL